MEALRLAWDEVFLTYDFGEGHPMAPLRLDLSVRLMRELGLPRSTSTELVVQTLYGAATMLKETGQHPTVLREQVSSPAGTTMAALRQLDDHKVRAAFLTAMEAARDRSRELSSGSA